MANHEATKKKIVDGLFELLKDNELASISVSNICQTASVSRMSYYRSFKSKDQIIDYKIDQIFTEFFNYLMTLITILVPSWRLTLRFVGKMLIISEF